MIWGNCFALAASFSAQDIVLHERESVRYKQEKVCYWIIVIVVVRVSEFALQQNPIYITYKLNLLFLTSLC